MREFICGFYTAPGVLLPKSLARPSNFSTASNKYIVLVYAYGKYHTRRRKAGKFWTDPHKPDTSQDAY